jgi:hypothetical protein
MHKQRIFIDLETGDTRPYAGRYSTVTVPVAGEVTVDPPGVIVKNRVFTAFTIASPRPLSYEELAVFARDAWQKNALPH